MKKIYAILFALVAFVSVASAQNDKVYLIKDGSVVKSYSLSDVDYITFTEPVKAEAWRVTGTYTAVNLDNATFKADLVCYTDGTYRIEAPYGEAGYNLDFTVEDGVPTFTNHYAVSGGYYSLAVSSKYYISAYTGSGYGSFSGNKEKGEIWFFAYTYDMDGKQQGTYGYDDFTWGATE